MRKIILIGAILLVAACGKKDASGPSAPNVYTVTMAYYVVQEPACPTSDGLLKCEINQKDVSEATLAAMKQEYANCTPQGPTTAGYLFGCLDYNTAPAYKCGATPSTDYLAVTPKYASATDCSWVYPQ